MSNPLSSELSNDEGGGRSFRPNIISLVIPLFLYCVRHEFKLFCWKKVVWQISIDCTESSFFLQKPEQMKIRKSQVRRNMVKGFLFQLQVLQGQFCNMQCYIVILENKIISICQNRTFKRRHFFLSVEKTLKH